MSAFLLCVLLGLAGGLHLVIAFLATIKATSGSFSWPWLVGAILTGYVGTAVIRAIGLTSGSLGEILGGLLGVLLVILILFPPLIRAVEE